MSGLCPYELEDDIWDEFKESDDHIVPHPSRENMNQVSAWNDRWKKSNRGVIHYSKDLDIANKCINKQKLKTQSFLGKGSALESASSCKEVKTMTSSGTVMANDCLKSSGADTEDGEFCISDSIIVGRSNAVDCDLYNYPDHISQGERHLGFSENDHEDLESNELLYYGLQDLGNFDDVDRMFRSCDSTFGLGNLVNEEESSWFGFSRASDGSEHASKPSFKLMCSEESALEGLAPNNKDFTQIKACGFDGKSISVEEKMDAEEHTSLERIEEVINHFIPKSASEDESVIEDQVTSFHSSQVKTVESPHKPSSDGPGKCFNGKKKTMLHHNVPAAVSRNFEQTSSVAFNKRVKRVLPSEIEMERHSEVEGIGMGVAGQIDSMNLEESFSMSSLLDEISLEAISFQQLQRVIEQLDVRTKLSIRDGLYRLARSAEQRHSYIDPKDKIGDNKEAPGILMVQDTKRCLGFPDMERDTNPIDRSIAHLLFHRPLDSSIMCIDDSCL